MRPDSAAWASPASWVANPALRPLVRHHAPAMVPPVYMQQESREKWYTRIIADYREGARRSREYFATPRAPAATTADGDAGAPLRQMDVIASMILTVVFCEAALLAGAFLVFWLT